jgi:geranylgeranyl pyrophosphate synthase
MIHTYSLIHDDLPSMDDDDLRRGRETCHVKFDEATAILAGDVLQTLAFKTLADDENLTNEMRVRIISEIASASGTPDGMVAGQQMDLDAEGEDLSIERIEEIHRSKTGALIGASATAGALIGSASADELQMISNFGSSLGLLFQITDDILDVTQSTEALGKTAGKDITAEKATYPSIHGLEGAERLASSIHSKAIENLKCLDRTTTLLQQIADALLIRQS